MGSNSPRCRRRHGAALFYEAAVGGGIPVVKTLRESLAGNTIQRVSASSTAPATTSCRAWRPSGCRSTSASPRRSASATPRPIRPSTSAASTRRTSSRFSPRSPSARGSTPRRSRSRASKSITLADLAAADELGFRIKLLGVAERTPHGVEQRVHPTMVPKSAPLAQTMGVLNAVSIDRRRGRRTDAGRARGRRRRDRLGGRVRHRRHCARRASAGLRPAGRDAGRGRPGADAAPRGRLLRAPRRRRPAGRDGGDRGADGRAHDLARSDHAEASDQGSGGRRRRARSC